jgi:cytolysin-activating lysine-acyltransferase
MNAAPLILICPSLALTEKSEAELFGAMVWLWMHSHVHRDCPLHELQRLLLPALQTGQFVLALQNNAMQQPAGLITWANLTAEAEQRYLKTLDRNLQPCDWQQGDRPWILDAVVPFGHLHVMASAVKSLLHRACFRSLYHHGDRTGLRVLHFRGGDVTPAQEADFWKARPLADSKP